MRNGLSVLKNLDPEVVKLAAEERFRKLLPNKEAPNNCSELNYLIFKEIIRRQNIDSIEEKIYLYTLYSTQHSKKEKDVSSNNNRKIDDDKEKSDNTKREPHRKTTKSLNEMTMDEYVRFVLLGQFLVNKVCTNAQEGWIENNIRRVMESNHSRERVFLSRKLGRQIKKIKQREETIVAQK